MDGDTFDALLVLMQPGESGGVGLVGLDLEPWMAEGACQSSSVDFFGSDFAAAKAVCARCPVRAPCLAYALDHESSGRRSGVWGGLGPGQRMRLASGDTAG